MKGPSRAVAAACLALAAAALLGACGTGPGTPGAAGAAGKLASTTGPGAGARANGRATVGASRRATARATARVSARAERTGASPSRTVSSPSPAARSQTAGPVTVPDRALDVPGGFWYGTDSWPVPVSGGVPYKTAAVGGSYGGYVGMAGNWARWQGCSAGNFLAWSGANSQQADENYSRFGAGIGTGVYWYMGGPGVDPRWDGTTAEAGRWGAAQAAQAIADADADHVSYPVLFMDIEMPGIKPAPDNGWQDVYTSPCSGVTRPGQYVTPALARAEFNGFDGYLTAHSRFKPGVYSDAGIWQQIFGTGKASRIPHTYEWTYETETADLRAAPRGWCLTGAASGCAQFFGGVTGSSPYAVMWQWSGGGGVSNSVGDFDQIDTATVR
jgi:hypothetical protein